MRTKQVIRSSRVCVGTASRDEIGDLLEQEDGHAFAWFCRPRPDQHVRGVGGGTTQY